MATEKRPLVTVVMPCLNEERYVVRALRSLFDEWSIKACEFLVVDGGSTDRTREAVGELIQSLNTPINPPQPPFSKGGSVNGPPLGMGGRGDFSAGQGDDLLPPAKDGMDDDVLWFASSRGSWVREGREGDRYDWNPPVGGRRRPVIRIVDNAFRHASRGLNSGILEARGAYIARADARSTYAPGYLRRCVELLEQKEAANAGGIEVPMAEGGRLGEAIALAVRHPLGGGSAKPGYSGYAASAATGTYRTKLFDELGLFDARPGADEAAEMNVRIVLAGRKIWVDGGLKVFRYVPSTLGELAKRYFRYGEGRARIAKKHMMFMSWRQIASPLLVAIMGFSIIRSFKAPSCLLFFAAYAAAVVAAALVGPLPPGGSGKVDLETRLALAAALMTLHVAGGAGFLWGLVAKW
jgi:succinoglycan biosynthesis protein ExoA